MSYEVTFVRSPSCLRTTTVTAVGHAMWCIGTCNSRTRILLSSMCYSPPLCPLDNDIRYRFLKQYQLEKSMKDQLGKDLLSNFTWPHDARFRNYQLQTREEFSLSFIDPWIKFTRLYKGSDKDAFDMTLTYVEYIWEYNILSLFIINNNRRMIFTIDKQLEELTKWFTSCSCCAFCFICCHLSFNFCTASCGPFY